MAKDKQSPAIFFDRDGTLCRDIPYCSCPEDLVLMPDAVQAIRTANSQGCKAVVITNQSGIARGYFSIQDLEKIHQKLLGLLAQEGVHLDGIYCCPHHPDEYCQCRKPKPGLFLRAAAELHIDLSSSYMIGDSLKDIQAGKNAGCRTILVRMKVPATPVTIPDYEATDLTSALRWIYSDKRSRGSI